MADFTLPSCKVVQTHEPTFGEQIKLGAQDLLPEDFIYAKFALIIPGMLRPEIEALSPRDGQALMKQVTRIWEGRSEEAALPLSNGGAPSLTGSSLEK